MIVTDVDSLTAVTEVIFGYSRNIFWNSTFSGKLTSRE